MNRHWGWQRHYSCSVREQSTRLSSCLWAVSRPPRPRFGPRNVGGKTKGRVASRRVPRTYESGGLRGRRPVDQQIAKVWRACQPISPVFSRDESGGPANRPELPPTPRDFERVSRRSGRVAPVDGPDLPPSPLDPEQTCRHALGHVRGGAPRLRRRKFRTEGGGVRRGAGAYRPGRLGRMRGPKGRASSGAAAAVKKVQESGARGAQDGMREAPRRTQKAQRL